MIKSIENQLENWSQSNVFDDARNKFVYAQMHGVVECFDCNRREPQTMYISNLRGLMGFTLVLSERKPRSLESN